MPESPIPRLEAWLEELGDASFVLATASPQGVPSARVVLLKEVRDGALVFGTALGSRKGAELRSNPAVAAVFTWSAEGRQVVLEGRAEILERAESDALWRTRGRDARLADLVSEEGAPLPDRGALEAAFARAAETAGEEPERPPGWAAVRILPARLEFWTADPRRLSVREEWRLGPEGWTTTALQP